MTKQFFIVTGLSGAGKSQALKILEDFGFFCVDNIPVALVPTFADLCLGMGGKLSRVALGIDVRAGESSLAQLNQVLEDTKKKGIKYRIIFFTASDATLLQRYSETRRRHPLGKRLIDGIQRERQLMQRMFSLSDKVIDTTSLNLSELKDVLSGETTVSSTRKMTVSVLSFGFKHGIPLNADLVFDVRFLPNPNYVTHLRAKTGQDLPVKKYVMSQELTGKFLTHYLRLLTFLIPNYVKEGKSYLTLAVGCTGGRHRSVVIAEATANFLKQKKHIVQIHHRDIGRGS
jgi:UPF0042 nucleotide-binding protein